MATWLFAEAIAAGKPLRLFNNGDLSRDVTYVDDIVEGVVRLLDRPARPDPQWSGAGPTPGSSSAPLGGYNIGANSPTPAPPLIALLEESLGRRAQIVLERMQPATCPPPGPTPTPFRPRSVTCRRYPLETGVPDFVDWFRRWRNL